MDQFYNKYIKYKSKYLKLLYLIDNIYIQYGGRKYRRKHKYIVKSKNKSKSTKIIPDGKQLDSDGMVYALNNSTSAIYYCDRNKRYKFYCEKKGLKLLIGLIKIIKQVLIVNNNQLKNLTTEEIDNIHKIGYDLYDQKPTLKKSPILGTWSNDEYGNIGLQWMYIKYKSYQRFTEVWSLLERCVNGGVLNISNIGNNLRIVSLGGGPGFELVAFDKFLNANLNIEYVSLDLQPNWKIYLDELGYKFNQYDINSHDIKPIIGDNPDKNIICILSNVLSICTNVHTADMFEYLLNKCNVKCILVNERGIKQKIVELLLKKNIIVYRLLDNSEIDRDDRQMIFLPSNSKLVYKLNNPTTFPNQPYKKTNNKLFDEN